MEAPLRGLRRVMMFNRTTIVIIVSAKGKTDAIRTGPDDDLSSPRQETRTVCLLPACRFIIPRVRHLSRGVSRQSVTPLDFLNGFVLDGNSHLR